MVLGSPFLYQVLIVTLAKEGMELFLPNPNPVRAYGSRSKGPCQEFRIRRPSVLVEELRERFAMELRK